VRRGGKAPFLDEPLPEGDAVVEVDFQDGDGGAPAGCQSDQDRSLPATMPMPFVATGVEQLELSA
jgi:hypothetical protein